jgi:hypothetical protein
VGFARNPCLWVDRQWLWCLLYAVTVVVSSVSVCFHLSQLSTDVALRTPTRALHHGKAWEMLKVELCLSAPGMMVLR